MGAKIIDRFYTASLYSPLFTQGYLLATNDYLCGMKLRPELRQYLNSLQIDQLNPLQEAALDAPELDMVLLAPTGSGKTLAFLLPLLQHLEPGKDQVQALVIVPSRELAIQIEQVFKSMGTGFKVNCFYGGHSLKTEVNNLLHPPALLIGTPGRIADHLKRKNFSASGIKTLILDEFDKSLEFGFEEDMAYISRRLKNLSKRVLTSATNLKKIPAFVGVKDPVVLDFLKKSSDPDLEYLLVETEAAEKLDTLFNLICNVGSEPMLVFCNHREAVDRISEILKDRGVVHETFHGGLDQEERERALLKFRNGSHYLLVTTDLASRGLDIPQVRHIIHYQLPSQEDIFIHRNGRTARMGASGSAYFILTEHDELPSYLNNDLKVMSLNDDITLPDLPEWETLHISGGRKDRINKIDIVGLFLKKGGLKKDELGLIEVKDHFSYAAVKRELANKLAATINNEKVKKKKIRVRLSR